jgi:hypothetical protein
MKGKKHLPKMGTTTTTTTPQPILCFGEEEGERILDLIQF